MASNVSSQPTFDLATLCKAMGPSAVLKTALKTHKMDFVDFGKKNSHILRKKLHDLFVKAGLTRDGQFLLYFLCSIMKKKERLRLGMKKLEDKFSTVPAWAELELFIDNFTVNFPDQETDESFALVHLPATNPPMVLICLAMATLPQDWTYEMVSSQQVFAQLNLSPEVQLENKAHIKRFWEVTVTKTTHTSNVKRFEEARTQGVLFDESIYRNQENDKYLLVNDHFNTVQPADPALGYTKEEIIHWMGMAVPAAQPLLMVAHPGITFQPAVAAGGAGGAADTASII